jgi:hypothetical protein
VAATTARGLGLGLPVATIGSRLRRAPARPADAGPARDLARADDGGPAGAVAFTLLGAIESLLSAVVADGMTGERHDPNMELCGQGAANLAVGSVRRFCRSPAPSPAPRPTCAPAPMGRWRACCTRFPAGLHAASRRRWGRTCSRRDPVLRARRRRALARSDLTFPEAIAKGMSLYLLFAIGFKGGVSVAEHGADAGWAGGAGRRGAVFLLPFVAFALLRVLARGSRSRSMRRRWRALRLDLDRDLRRRDLAADGQGHRTRATWSPSPRRWRRRPSSRRCGWPRAAAGRAMDGDLWREILLNGSIVLLLGAFAIGWITGERGLAEIAPSSTRPSRACCACSCWTWAGRGARPARRGRGCRPGFWPSAW